MSKSRVFNPQDYYFKKAKQENYVARSVFKLEEIQKKFRLIRPGMAVLDLGAAPGSWSQFLVKEVGPKGKVVGIDLSDCKFQDRAFHFLKEDIFSVDFPKLRASLGIDQFDLVVSDMAPKTTGIKSADQAKSVLLCEKALEVAVAELSPRGHFVCKFFHSDDFQSLKKLILTHFEKFAALKPESTRQISKEIFLVGLDKK